MSESENPAETGKDAGEQKVDRREAMKTVVRNSAYAVPIATVMLTKSRVGVAGGFDDDESEAD